jgi:integrase
VLLAVWCGLRRGEVLGLHRPDIDLVAGRVTVRRNRVELLATGTAFDAQPKTDAGKRTVTVPPHVLPLLAEHMATWAGPDRVFVGRDDRPMRGDAIRQAFDRARRNAGMPGFRFHDLRHTANTRMMLAGVLQEVRREIIGHSSRRSRDVNDRYTQIELPEKREAIRKLEVWLEGQERLLQAESQAPLLLPSPQPTITPTTEEPHHDGTEY